MINKIKEMLKKKNIISYKIHEEKTLSIELFFIKKNLDMDRNKKVHHYKVTVYKDYEDKGVKYKGNSTTNIHPTMNENEIEKALDDASFAAGYVKNPYYPLTNDSMQYKNNQILESDFSRESLSHMAYKIGEAIYSVDKYDKGGINSCEIFLNKKYSRILNSEGVDIEAVSYNCLVEFISTWKEDDEEVELYKSMNFSEFSKEDICNEVEKMISFSKDKARAKNTPDLNKATVILTHESVKELFTFYYAKSCAESVYNKNSEWNIGDKVQGDAVKGDNITLIIDPFMKNSTFSRSFDNDGYPLEKINVIEDGELKNYIGDIRFGHYLNVKERGMVKNFFVKAGNTSILDMRKESYLEIAAFSDFNVDNITGDLGGEIRLGFYYDGNERIPVTGGSITGNIYKLHDEMFLSKEIQKDNEFEGPKAVKFLNVTVSGMK